MSLVSSSLSTLEGVLHFISWKCTAFLLFYFSLSVCMLDCAWKSLALVCSCLDTLGFLTFISCQGKAEGNTFWEEEICKGFSDCRRDWCLELVFFTLESPSLSLLLRESSLRVWWREIFSDLHSSSFSDSCDSRIVSLTAKCDETCVWCLKYISEKCALILQVLTFLLPASEMWERAAKCMLISSLEPLLWTLFYSLFYYWLQRLNIRRAFGAPFVVIVVSSSGDDSWLPRRFCIQASFSLRSDTWFFSMILQHDSEDDIRRHQGNSTLLSSSVFLVSDFFLRRISSIANNRTEAIFSNKKGVSFDKKN